MIKGGYAGIAVQEQQGYSESGTVMNAGRIVATGTKGVGVSLTVGGLVSNAASAAITASFFAIEISGGAGTVVNRGSIPGIPTSTWSAPQEPSPITAR